MAYVNLYGNDVQEKPLRKKGKRTRKLYPLVYPKPYDTIYPEHHPLNKNIFPEMYGKIDLKKSLQKVKDKLKKASPLQKALAAVVLGPIAPTLVTTAVTAGAAKKTIDYAASKNPKLKAKIEQFKKLPLQKKIALAAGGALIAPLIPAVAAVAIPTALAAAPVAATIKGAKVAAAKIKAVKAAKAAQAQEQIIEESQAPIVPVSARTEAGLEAAVNEAVEKPVAEEKKTTTGSVLKWIAPLAALPFFFGEV